MEDLSGLKTSTFYQNYAENGLRCGGLDLVHRKLFQLCTNETEQPPGIGRTTSRRRSCGIAGNSFDAWFVAAPAGPHTPRYPLTTVAFGTSATRTKEELRGDPFCGRT